MYRHIIKEMDVFGYFCKSQISPFLNVASLHQCVFVSTAGSQMPDALIVPGFILESIILFIAYCIALSQT